MAQEIWIVGIIGLSKGSLEWRSRQCNNKENLSFYPCKRNHDPNIPKIIDERRIAPHRMDDIGIGWAELCSL